MGKSSAKIARVFVAAFISLVGVQRIEAAPPVFQGLGDLPGGSFFSSANDISDDGRVVVGNSNGDAGPSFRWTASGGMQGLAMPSARATNADGSTIVGAEYRWTQATGVVLIEGLDPQFDWGASATGVSGDGSTIVGRWDQQSGFRWDAPHGPMKVLNGFYPASDISFDGKTIVGTGIDNHAVLWRASSGFVPLGAIPNEDIGIPTALSYDANVVVGSSIQSGAVDAWRWTPATGMVNLGGIGASPAASIAADVSADGALVVGYSGNLVPGPHGQVLQTDAFLWGQHVGVLPLKNWLISNHVSGLDNWRLTEAHAISANGRAIVGVGINPAGNTEGWIVNLPSPGDTNGDGLVDGADYTAWADHFNQQSNRFADGDFNWDGVVDGADYVIWADHFAPARASMTVSAVPEPSSFLLAGMGVAALLARRQRVAW